jgi:superfamily II DNA or RNA helicase
LNETFLRIDAEESIQYELNDYFSFYALNYKFDPRYKAHCWDGKIKLHHLNDHSLPVGLYPRLLEFARSRNYQIQQQNIFGQEKIEQSSVDDYIRYLNLSHNGIPIIPRDTQPLYIRSALQNKRILLVSPVASGKSLLIYCISRYFLEKNMKGLLITPRANLVEQMWDDFKDYSELNGWQIEQHCQKLYSGFSKNLVMPLTISTWQSCATLPTAIFEQFQFVIYDEVHLSKATISSKIMKNCVNAFIRIGTTGTISDEKVNKLQLEALFGPVVQYTTTRQEIDKKQLSNMKVNCIVLNYPEELCKQIRGFDYQKEIKFIVHNEKRNKFICNLAENCKGNTLVLTQFRDKHVEVIYKLLGQKNLNRSIYKIHGNVPIPDRLIIQNKLDSENDAILVATIGVLQLGANIPSIANIIFASPYKSKTVIIQSIGRGLRLDEAKEMLNVYDISDNLNYKSKKKTGMKHLTERIKLYVAEGFDFKTYEVNI